VLGMALAGSGGRVRPGARGHIPAGARIAPPDRSRPGLQTTGSPGSRVEGDACWGRGPGARAAVGGWPRGERPGETRRSRRDECDPLPGKVGGAQAWSQTNRWVGLETAQLSASHAMLRGYAVRGVSAGQKRGNCVGGILPPWCMGRGTGDRCALRSPVSA